MKSIAYSIHYYKIALVFISLICISGNLSTALGEGFYWPVDCIPGLSCDGKNSRIGFPDMEGVGIAYSCGPASYTGHQGTDILVSSLEQQTSVLAAADGVVQWLEDGLYDKCPNSSKWDCAEQRKSFINIDEKVKASLGFNAGNYVVVEHVLAKTRYLTLYAHLQKGSLRVIPGQRISRGDVLAAVGSSGNSLTPHLHFGVFRQDKDMYRPVDPWKGACNKSSDGLWAFEPPYQPNSVASVLKPEKNSDSIHLVKAQQVTPSKEHLLKTKNTN